MLERDVSGRWWRWEELNLRHGAYETPALPLSYTAGALDANCLGGGRLPEAALVVEESLKNHAGQLFGTSPSLVAGPEEAHIAHQHVP